MITLSDLIKKELAEEGIFLPWEMAGGLEITWILNDSAALFINNHSAKFGIYSGYIKDDESSSKIIRSYHAIEQNGIKEFIKAVKKILNIPN